MSNILIVDDEPSICWALQQALAEDGHAVEITATAESALKMTQATPPDVIVLDVRLPGMDGLTALQHLKSQNSATPIIIITAFGNLDTAVQALNRGAFEYLTKPFDLEAALQIIQKALESRRESPRVPHVPTLTGQALIGSSPAMQAVFRDIAIVAERDVPVLITGESGTGKELVAAAIHRYSKRSQNPFVPICIPAMNESVLESELFGHAKGAFTGAVEHRRGLLELADGGTAFLDEIGDVSIPTQVKLLRVLESKAVTPVGENQPRQSDFRLLAATNRNLQEMIAGGTFREDLFYRLNVYQIVIPPLRERKEDIPLLAKHFIEQLGPDGKISLTQSAIEELQRRTWSGNIRELRNAVEHAVIVTRTGEISADAFPASSPVAEQPTATSSISHSIEQWIQEHMPPDEDHAAATNLYEKFLDQFEPLLLAKALAMTQGNRQDAAHILGIHRQTLREKLKKHNLD